MEETITAWIARDEDGGLYCFYHGKPIKVDGGDWELPTKNYWDYVSLDKNLFPQIKWEDEEPTKVELTIKICE